MAPEFKKFEHKIENLPALYENLSYEYEFIIIDVLGRAHNVCLICEQFRDSNEQYKFASGYDGISGYDYCIFPEDVDYIEVIK